jgi:hypothetical protein
MAENLGMTIDQADDRGRFDAAKAAIDNEIDLAFENLANFEGIVEGLLLSGWDQRAAHYRLPEFHQQRMHDRVVRNTYADGLAFRVHQATWHLRSRFKQKRIGARGQGFHQAIIRIANLGVAADFRQVAAYQGEVVFVVGASNALNPFHRGLIADVTTERIARIGGVDHQSATIDDRYRLLDKSSLRIIRMNFKELRHKSYWMLRVVIIQEIVGKKTTIKSFIQNNKLAEVFKKGQKKKADFCYIFATKSKFVVFFVKIGLLLCQK